MTHGREGNAGRDQAPARVLVIDDEPVILDLLRLVLEDSGHQVVCCLNGCQALDLIHADDFDVVLSDLALPDTDGIRIYETLRHLKHPAAQRLVILTGDVADAEATAYFERENIPTLRKPFDLAVLKRTVSAMLARQRPVPA